MKIIEYKKEIIIGVISLMGGIIGSILFAQYQSLCDEAKPEIRVRDFSFDNSSEDLIRIENYFISNSDKFVSFRNFMSYNDLRQNEIRLGNLVAVHKQLNISLTSWVNNISKNKLLSNIELNSFPILDNRDYSKIFLNSLKNNFLQVPHSSEFLSSLPNRITGGIVPINIKENRINLILILFNKERTIYNLYGHSKENVKFIQLFIDSFKKNDKDNIMFFSEIALKYLEKKTAKYQEMLDRLQIILLNHSNVKMKIDLYNKGKETVLIQPVFKLQLLNKENIIDEYLLYPNLWDDNDIYPKIDNMMDFIEKIKNPMYKEMLPDYDNINNNNYKSLFQVRKISPQISTKGGGTFSLTLESKVNLLENGINIRKWYESGRLSYKLVGITVEDDLLQTTGNLSEKDLQDELKNKLEL